MIKYYAIFIFFCTFYIVTSTNKTDVFYDPKYDIIFHNGKLYFPNKDTIGDKKSNGNLNHNSNSNTHASTNSNHEEELVSGTTFWVYIIIILCKTI